MEERPRPDKRILSHNPNFHGLGIFLVLSGTHFFGIIDSRIMDVTKTRGAGLYAAFHCDHYHLHVTGSAKSSYRPVQRDRTSL